jgi:hypothetical protein
MKVDGGCHCGSIKFEAEIDPADVGVCHCTDCQSLSGTAFTTYVFASAAVDKPERYNLRLGTIRQRHELRPQVQIWCRSALDWVMDLGSVKQVPRQP